MKRIRKYGKVGLATYVVVDLISLAGFTLLVHNGLDIGAILDNWGISHEKIQQAGTSLFSAWIVAIALNKLTFPIRLPIALAVTPRVHKWWYGDTLDKTHPNL